MSFKKVAIVGSNGFIGRHLTNKLLHCKGINLSLFGKNAHCVSGYDHLYKKVDITDEIEVRNSFNDVDIIYYLASETIPATTWLNPTLEIEKNLLPFIKFMEVITTLNTKKVIFTSSAGTIYGHTDQKAAEDSFKNPFSPHGIIKLTMEYFLNYFNVKYGVSFDVYRIPNVYGPGQNTGKGLGIINTFIEKIVSENQIRIYGDGKNVRNYIYVEDLAELMALSLTTDIARSEIYNASSDDTLTINELVEVLRKTVSENFEVVYASNRKSDNPAIYLDNTKILNAIPGFKFTGIEEGIRKTYEHIRGKA